MKMDKNAGVLSTLDSYKDYAAEYEKRKNMEKPSSPSYSDQIKQTVNSMKQRKIEDEIAETLRKINEREKENVKRFEEERKQKEEKMRKEAEIKNKIQEELNKILELEAKHAQQIREQERIREIARLKEQEEEERRVEEEEKKITRRQQQEEIKKVMQETIEMKRKKLKEEKAKQLEEELKEKKIKEQRQRQEDQEKERLRAVELEKARLWKEETERQRRKEEKERILKFEEAKRISSALMERKKLEEEEQKKLKSEIDEGKIKEVEKLKKETLEEKIKKLFDGKKKKENVQEIEKPKKKIANNSMALKFEELSRAAELEEQARKDLQEKKRIMKERTRNIIHRSKQILHKMSKENLKKSQSLLNNENHKITRMNVSSSESKEEMNKKAMQNYLISQVLFDKEENITCSGIKEKQAEVESMEKKINSELRRIKNKEEERALRQQEQHFENYKQEMEKYLQFVCEENKVKKKKKKAAKKEENFPMINRLNIQDIQNSFEENSKQTFTGGTSPDAVTVSKLDTAKFLQPTENPGPKTKENISVIIDKTALKRTISLFEKEKKEKEEQERIAELSKKKDRKSTFWAKHFMNKSQKSSDLAEKDHSLEKSDLEENTILQDSEVLCEAGESIKENGMRKNDVEKMKSLELKRLKNVEEERILRQQEENFELYKQEMEKYLQFVCEENKIKNKKKKVAEKDEPTTINRLNIQDIQNSFEEHLKQSLKTPTSPDRITVNKLDPTKFLQQDESSAPKKKEYVPVIIDKAAFERTVGIFENENKEEEEQDKYVSLSKKVVDLNLSKSDFEKTIRLFEKEKREEAERELLNSINKKLEGKKSNFWAKHFQSKCQKASKESGSVVSGEFDDTNPTNENTDLEIDEDDEPRFKKHNFEVENMEKKITSELKRLKNVEEERILRQQEENFELYKQEMEKYLQFVCEENKIKNKKKKVAEKDEPTAINRLNIQDIQNSFEEHLKQSLKTPTSPDRITVNKLDPTKFLQQGENSATKQKENIQVIIDKAAFERTLEVFKKEKKDGGSKKSLSSNKEDQKSNFWAKHFMNRSESKPDLLESIKPKDPKPPLRSVKPSDAEREKSSVKQLLEDPIKKVDSYSRKIYNSISGSKDCLTENLSKQRLSIAPQQPAPRLNQFIKPTRPLPSENEDLEDISDSDGELEEYKQQLKEQYAYLDLIHSSRESTPEKNQRKTGSFSSLMNILQTMKKSKISQKYTDSKSRVLNFSDSKPGMSRSEMNLPTVSGSCSNIKQMFDSGSIFSSTRRSSVDQDFRDVIPERKKDFKSFLISTFEGKEKIKPRNFDDDSDSSSEDLIPKLRQKSNKSEISEEDFNGSQTISSELQALRKCSVMKGFNKLDKGSSQINESRTRPGPVMRRSNSCVGIPGEMLKVDLDEKTLTDLSASNRMVKAMFETSAPKYKFGGSGIIHKDSEIQSNKKVLPPKSQENRKWVLDSINKYFDVIAEEEDDEDEDDEDEDESEYEESSEIEEPPPTKVEAESSYKSSSKMRGLLCSVASRLTGSVSNLSAGDVIQTLKKNLGSQINLRASNKDLSQL